MLDELKKAWLDAIRFSGTFTGCMSRKHFWLTVPVAYSVAFVLGFGLLSALALSKDGNIQPLHPALVFLIAAVVIALCFFTWTHSVRRLHDTGRTGWWVLLANASLFPYSRIIFLLILLYLMTRPRRPNSYGKSIPASWDIRCAWIAAILILSGLIAFGTK